MCAGAAVRQTDQLKRIDALFHVQDEGSEPHRCEQINRGGVSNALLRAARETVREVTVLETEDLGARVTNR